MKIKNCHIGLILSLLIFDSCSSKPPLVRKLVTNLKVNDTIPEYRAYLTTSPYDTSKLATDYNIIDVTAVDKGERLLKSYKGYKYVTMSLKPWVELIVHLHDGRRQTEDTILLKQGYKP